MSAMDYLHGSGVQDIINARRRMSDIEQVEAEWMETAIHLKNEIANRDRVIRDLNAKLSAVQSEAQINRDALAAAKAQMAQKQREFQAAFKKMGARVGYEAADIHDATIDWICRYGEVQSHEFIQGLRHIFKQAMPMSQSESVRNRFLKDFEEKARAEALASQAAGKGYFVSEERLDTIAGGLASKMAIEEQARIRRLMAQKVGIRKDVGAGRSSDEAGPADIAAAVGEGVFVPPEPPKGSVGRGHKFLAPAPAAEDDGKESAGLATVSQPSAK